MCTCSSPFEARSARYHICQDVLFSQDFLFSALEKKEQECAQLYPCETARALPFMLCEQPCMAQVIEIASVLASTGHRSLAAAAALDAPAQHAAACLQVASKYHNTLTVSDLS